MQRAAAGAAGVVGRLAHDVAGSGAPARFAYVHGFASGPLSQKGRALAAAFAARGATLALPDLNRPSFEELTPGGMLAALDELDAAGTGRWGLVGSSLGGWVAARWAELHPRRVARLVLLAPALDLPGRWRELVTAEQLRDWEASGWIAATDGAGRATRLHWGFWVDAVRQPPMPAPVCPTLILHGRADETVPLSTSEAYVARHPEARLEVLPDGHDLLLSLPRVIERAVAWLVPSSHPASG